jgi:hypothetical protein
MPLDRSARLLGPVALVAIMLFLAGRTGPDAPSAAADLILVLATAGPLALAWIVAAIGLGRVLRGWLVPRAATDGMWIQVGLGIAIMLALDAALARLGLLTAGSGLVAGLVLLAGIALAAEQAARGWAARTADRVMPRWITWTAAPAVAVLLVAACSAPGWLWSSEFGGYDALSYHLQLPKEWLALGRASGLEHNVYSFLPGYVECAYLHLATIAGDAVRAAPACQLLHAGLTIIAAALTGRVAHRLGGRAAGIVAFVLVLGTPWTIVVGSLAYNEMAVTTLLAAGLLVCLETSITPVRRGIALGAIIAAACGAKLTAVGFVAAPLLVVHLWTTSRRRWAVSTGAMAASALALGLPYLLYTLLVTGNPVFPFLAGILGRHHWTPDQVAIWSGAHGGGTGVGRPLLEGWNQLARYGIGPNPDPAEPWSAQWSILPWLAIAGLIIARRAATGRAWTWRLATVLSMQILFWLALTHVKSRFMLPGVVPMAVLAGLGAAALLPRLARPLDARSSILGPALGAIALLVFACMPARIYLFEQRGAPAVAIGRMDLFTGDDLDETGRRDLGTTLAPSIAVNHLLPDGGRVLLVGEAAPLYFDLDRIAYQTTWDRGPLSQALRAHTGDPDAWLAALRAEGFTHVLVHFDMLRRWEASGWNDPWLDADALEQALDLNATVLTSYGGPPGDPARWAVLYGL